jgi:hypothetical protein
MPTVTAADLTTYFDERSIADLLSDTGTAVADLANDTRLTAIISSAKGQVASALTVADLHTAADLESLTGDDLQLYKQIVATLAMARLCGRRPGSEFGTIHKAAFDEAEGMLERIRKGERIFSGLDAQRAAGVPDIDGPTVATYERLNLLPDRTRNYYPSRAGRLPIGRQ